MNNYHHFLSIESSSKNIAAGGKSCINHFGITTFHASHLHTSAILLCTNAIQVNQLMYSIYLFVKFTDENIT